MIAVLFFIAGAIVGSFLNVCIYRIPRKESIILPASHCTYCDATIPWFDNIPILSFLLLKGKCRFCAVKIPAHYPLVEILSGIISALFFLRFGLTAKFFILWTLANALIVVSFIDMRFYEIPDSITVPGILTGLCVATIYPGLMGKAGNLSSFLDSFLGIIVGGGSVYIVGFIGEFIFKKEAMGGGDVKLLTMIGSFLGWKLVLFTFFLAPFLGSIVGIIFKLKYGRDIIPYGPFLSLAAIFALLWGDKAIKAIFLL